MDTQKEQISNILANFSLKAVYDVAGAATVNMDGIVYVSHMDEDVNVDRICAVAATMLGVTRRVCAELSIGIVQETILRADKGMFMILPAGNTHLLAVNLRQGANLGMVRLQAATAAQEINDVLHGDGDLLLRSF